MLLTSSLTLKVHRIPLKQAQLLESIGTLLYHTSLLEPDLKVSGASALIEIMQVILKGKQLAV